MMNFWSKAGQFFTDTFVSEDKTKDEDYQKLCTKMTTIETGINNLKLILKGYNSYAQPFCQYIKTLNESVSKIYNESPLRAQITEIINRHEFIIKEIGKLGKKISKLYSKTSEWDTIFEKAKESIRTREEKRKNFDHYEQKLLKIGGGDQKIKSRKEDENESDEELILNNDDYHEMGIRDNKSQEKNNFKNNINNINITKNKATNNNNNNSNRCESGKNFIKVNCDQDGPNKRNKKVDIKDILEKSIYQESKTEKKIIVGLNEIKVISLKKKINNKKNSDTQILIKDNNNNKKSNDSISNDKKQIQIKNYIKTSNNTQRQRQIYINAFSSGKNKNIIYDKEKNNNKLGSTNKNITQLKKESVPSLNILLSPNITKSSEHLFIKNNKNIAKLLSPKIKTNKNQCNII